MTTIIETQIKSAIDCETDHVMCDHEGVDTIDVWGYDPNAPEGEMLWRLAIRFEESE